MCMQLNVHSFFTVYDKKKMTMMTMIFMMMMTMTVMMLMMMRLKLLEMHPPTVNHVVLKSTFL